MNTRGSLSLRDLVAIGVLGALYIELTEYMVAVTRSDFLQGAWSTDFFEKEFFYALLFGGVLLGPVQLYLALTNRPVSKKSLGISMVCLFYLVWNSPFLKV